MKKWDDLVEYLQDKNLVGNEILSKYCTKNEIKKDKYGIYIIIGVVISTLLIITLLLIYKKNNV